MSRGSFCRSPSEVTITSPRAWSKPADAWREVLRQIEADAPAIFLYAPTYVYAVKRRFRDVTITPASSWQLLREWSGGR